MVQLCNKVGWLSNRWVLATHQQVNHLPTMDGKLELNISSHRVLNTFQLPVRVFCGQRSAHSVADYWQRYDCHLPSNNVARLELAGSAWPRGSSSGYQTFTERSPWGPATPAESSSAKSNAIDGALLMNLKSPSRYWPMEKLFHMRTVGHIQEYLLQPHLSSRRTGNIQETMRQENEHLHLVHSYNGIFFSCSNEWIRD